MCKFCIFIFTLKSFSITKIIVPSVEYPVYKYAICKNRKNLRVAEFRDHEKCEF